MKKRILLLCDTYPPDLGVGGRRWQKFVDILQENYEFTIIAGTYDISKLGKQKGNVHRVAYSKFRLDRLIGTFGGKPRQPEKDANKSKEPLKEQNSSNWRKKLGRQFEWLRSLRAITPVIDLNRIYSSNLIKYVHNHWNSKDFDLIIASHPGSGNLFAANKLAALWDCPWIADFRDPWSEDYHSPFKEGGFFEKMLFRLETHTLKSSHKILTINEELAAMIRAKKENVEIVHNSLIDVPKCNSKNVDPANLRAISLGYAGCVVDKSDYVLLVRAQDQLGEQKIVWNYWGPSGADIYFSSQISRELIAYEAKGNIALGELDEHIQKCDYLVIFGYNGKSSKCIHSGKVFDYLHSGRPILMIGGEKDSALYRLLSETSQGYWLKNEQEIITFFKERKYEERQLFRGDVRRLNDYLVKNTSVKLNSIIQQVFTYEH